MALADLIKSRSSSVSLEGPSAAPSEDAFPSPVEPTPSEGPSSEAGQQKGGDAGEAEEPDVVNPEPASPEEEPYGVNETTTPAGIQVYYQAGPKRLYRIRQNSDSKWVDIEASISQVCDILEKGGLPWWGMKVGVAGVLQLLEDGVLRPDGRHELVIGSDTEPVWQKATVDLLCGNRDLGIKGLLTQHRLTVNHVLGQAGDRGKSVHDALENWAEKAIVPQPAVYTAEEQGYVAGLVDFLTDSGVEPLAAEVMVGSVKHKIAGRFDLRARIPNGAEVVVKTFPKAKPIRAKVKGGDYLLDLKTSKDVYDTHYLQLEAYEAASLECGYDPTLYRGVIHVTGDGRYELQLNVTRVADEGKQRRYLPDFENGKPLVNFTDFKHVLAAKKALDRIKGRK